MTIGTLCTRDAATLPQDATVEDAAILMRARHVGDVVIVGCADRDMSDGELAT